MSGARPPFRSPKFGEGMTSETIDESGLNAFIPAPTQGIGRARWRFASGPSVAWESGGINRIKKTEKHHFQDSHYPFVMPVAQPQRRRQSRIFTGCVQDASPTEARFRQM